MKIKNTKAPDQEPHTFKAHISDNAKDFKKKVGPHPLGNKAGIPGFWYRGNTSKTWTIFNTKDQLGPSYHKFLEQVKGLREVEASWWFQEQDAESP